MHTTSDARKRAQESVQAAFNARFSDYPSTSDYIRDLCRRKLALEEQVIELKAANEALRKTIKRLSDESDPIKDAEPVVQEWPLDEHGRFRA